MKYRNSWTGKTLVALWVVVLGVGSGCAEKHSTESIGSTAQQVQVSSAGSCTVVWRKIDYDQPGTDTRELIELKAMGFSSGDTLGDCGLAEIQLVNGSVGVNQCDGTAETYDTIDVSAVSIPSDGYVDICNSASGLTCDYDVGHNDWLQNGAPDGLAFWNTSNQATLAATYEGMTPCLPYGPNVVTVQDENNSSPNMINIWCTDHFALVNQADAPLRADNQCPTPEGGVDAGGAGGSSGAAGAGGTTGNAGAGGTTGNAGAGGTTGNAGAGGTTGNAGAGGTTGSAGAGGTTGSAGSGGTAGSAGSGGTAGSAGTGAAGSAGTGATGGSAGAGGTAGSAGTGATGGSAGTGATGGSAGTGGTAGTDGGGVTGGTAGYDGGAGSAGSPSSGNNGGCGCSTPGDRPPAEPFALLGLAAGVLVFERRRRRNKR